MIYLTPVDLYSNAHANILYDLLAERTVQQSISHKAMPTFKEHCQFLQSKPYEEWYLIGADGDYVGATYLSRAREIGIFIFNEYHGRGYGREAVREMVARFGNDDLLANINPENEASKKLFTGLNFEPLQVTYILRGVKV